MTKHINCLEIDAGGARGIIVLEMLARVENSLTQQIKLKDHFQYMSGCSTGALIITLLKKGYTAGEILEIYKRELPRIFDKKWYRWSIFRPKYSDDTLNAVLTRYLGRDRVSDWGKEIMIPIYDFTNEKLIFYKSYSDSPLKSNEFMFNILRSTVSAQTYFKPWEFNGSKHIDGGNVCANTTLAMISDVSETHKHFNVLSISTGLTVKDTKVKKNGGGILFWVKRTIDHQMEQQVRYTEHIAKRMMVSHGNYLRVEPVLEFSSGKMDDVSKENIDGMVSDGRLFFDQVGESVRRFILDNR